MRRWLATFLQTIMALSSTFMLWQALCLITNSSCPIIVVISESMAPAFHRGDVLLLYNRQEDIRVEDVPVVWFSGHPLPMVHRAVQVHWALINHKPTQLLLTKGDNNEVVDVPLYPPGRHTVTRSEVIGLVRGYVPWLGWIAIAPRDFPWLSTLIILVGDEPNT
ncbi:putative signal peptidase I [Aureobasidium namibiae CBS 147.97]|uniref:Signal peptidase complex catalytic subunit SEC11 n=1 Tax=Aureobasidium namibiae CBS 147.97 TaxID=1043004 RepID=A0A074W4S4_9PEZI|nr:putative signal peptidase I [Aureobasidium namibiae CBS 147.97]KEQ68105.1 putative signal peptidase I [Aureobasidium namibiae CBS 147.97]